MTLKKTVDTFKAFHVVFIFISNQNDQSTQDLHIDGAENLSVLSGKVKTLFSYI